MEGLFCFDAGDVDFGNRSPLFKLKNFLFYMNFDLITLLITIQTPKIFFPKNTAALASIKHGTFISSYSFLQSD